MRTLLIYLAICTVAISFSGIATAQIYSELWGKNGEKWSPSSRLPDFSFAGYHFGEDPLPKPKVTANVKTFGARGDGKTDDTEAFNKAIEATTSGAIFIPKGRYILRDILWIKKSNIVLRGEGADKTILHFPVEMEDVRPNTSATTSGRPTSRYSWSGGFIWVKGWAPQKAISAISSEHKRGEKTLTVEASNGIKVGQRVLVELKDDGEKTLLAHLYSNDSGDVGKIMKPISVSMVSRVAAIKGNHITLERPLRWDIRKAWKPTLKSFTPAVSEVGIEDLAISFPLKPYKGHFTEKGMNGIAMNGVSDCWIRNVRISNCDSGVFVEGAFCRIDGLRIDGDRKATRGDTGHHGVTMGQDCMLQRFDFQTKFIHDITFSNKRRSKCFCKNPFLHFYCVQERLLCLGDIDRYRIK